MWGSEFFPALGGCMAFCTVLYTSILKVGKRAILKWKASVFSHFYFSIIFLKVKKSKNEGILIV